MRVIHALLWAFLIMAILFGFLCIKGALAENTFQVTTSLSLGLSTAHDCQFVDLQLGGSLYGFTLYGGAYTDVSQVDTFSFVPLRSIYSVGFKYQYEWFEIGWYHECTHKGDGSSRAQWFNMYRPTENNFYVTFTFKKGG